MGSVGHRWCSDTLNLNWYHHTWVDVFWNEFWNNLLILKVRATGLNLEWMSWIWPDFFKINSLSFVAAWPYYSDGNRMPASTANQFYQALQLSPWNLLSLTERGGIKDNHLRTVANHPSHSKWMAGGCVVFWGGYSLGHIILSLLEWAEGWWCLSCVQRLFITWRATHRWLSCSHNWVHLVLVTTVLDWLAHR